jgi:hypothetical protein
MFENLEQLHTTRSKRVFIFSASALFLLQVLVLGIINYKSDHLGEIAFSLTNEVLVHLIAASITAIFLVLLLIYLLPIEEQQKVVEVLDPSHTKVMHDAALRGTDFWFHQGHIGRWVRIAAMPAMAKSSVEHGATATIKLLVLNPKNEELCNHYLDYRRRIPFKENDIRTVPDVQAEILATVLLASYFHHAHSGLIIHVYLADQLILTRDDISATVAFRTQIDPRCPSLAFRNVTKASERSEFYSIARLNFEYAARRADEIQLTQCAELATLDRAQCVECLTTAKLLIHNNNAFLDNVIRRVRSDYHPYN